MTELMIQSLIEKHGLVQEFGWEGEMFLVWIPYTSLTEFMNVLGKMIGYDGFVGDGEFDCKLRHDEVCFNFVPFADYLCADLEKIFPKEKYKH